MHGGVRDLEASLWPCLPSIFCSVFEYWSWAKKKLFVTHSNCSASIIYFSGLLFQRFLGIHKDQRASTQKYPKFLFIVSHNIPFPSHSRTMYLLKDHSLLLDIRSPIFFSLRNKAPILVLLKHCWKELEEVLAFLYSSSKIFWISFFSS